MSKHEFASASFTAGQLNALVKKVGPKNVPEVLDGSKKIKVVEMLLEQLDTVKTPRFDRFVPSEHLEEANVRLVNEGFKDLFLDHTERVLESTLVISCLRLERQDLVIVAELGRRAKISMAQFFSLLTNQANGQDGVLLAAPSRTNVAYSVGLGGDLWAVTANWHSSHRNFWEIGAYSIGSSLTKSTGTRVISLASPENFILSRLW